ncbi:acetyl-CoA hydrolase/transferase family protein [Mongoliitalea daihaiensis]|uniref:acetyl-CoA hydrolase/transferase family protein n=1 Tax=Mongoliitalea daihaiensis TaxID=2782006 RepID=UPI001F46BEB0|nr:acetyl-CoA hydrolase/transferase C-terminal domain-containing protein [Mongoliitalea daihaiensis]UJP63719.1 acetyl-CoA hydrolase/transferase family protein [Mongoliitalea daihaiensis]
MNISSISGPEAVQLIKSGNRVFLHGSAATPTHLIKCLAERASELSNVEIVSISSFGPMPLANEENRDSFFFNSLFVSQNIRHAANSLYGGYVPIFLSEIGQLFKRKILALDVAIVQVSPPDAHGYCSLGVSVDIAKAAVDSAPIVIAQINEQMPRTHGDGHIHISRFTASVYIDEPLHEVNYAEKISEEELIIGNYIAELIEDRSCLQLGIGAIPDAVLQALTNHRDLGIHTEMFSNGLIPLLESGAVTNAYKKKHKGKVLTSFAAGSKKLYNFIHDNPLFTFHEAEYVNDTAVIRKNPRMISINSCIEIDLTGQVCADSIGTFQFSGVGGQMDFIRGASLSDGGKPIMALSACTKKGLSKIVPTLQEGAGVVTTRAHMHYVVTEFGVAYLYGKNLKQRAKALQQIAHPDHRETLDIAIFERFGKTYY